MNINRPLKYTITSTFVGGVKQVSLRDVYAKAHDLAWDDLKRKGCQGSVVTDTVTGEILMRCSPLQPVLL